MFEKSEIICALDITKEKCLDKEILNMFDKREVLGILNKNRWKHGASEHEGTFMTETEFEKIIQNRKFFSTINKIGIKG